MTYHNCPQSQCREYISHPGIESVVNKFYISIDSLNVNNGIQHSIAAERTGDIHVYSQTIDNRIGIQQNNYVVNLDNRKVEFISPYICSGEIKDKRYLGSEKDYLSTSPDNSCYCIDFGNYHNTITHGLLKKTRPVTQFINGSEEIKGLLTETFERLTGQALPTDIAIRVCREEELRTAHQLHGGRWSRGIMGFAINNRERRSIFLRKNHLDALMLTAGHEIGHVLTERLGNEIDEEAKAFAFELAWAKTIVENNIGGLAGNFNTDFAPAENGLHDRAFAFVQGMVRRGKEAFIVFRELAEGILILNQKEFI